MLQYNQKHLKRYKFNDDIKQLFYIYFRLGTKRM